MGLADDAHKLLESQNRQWALLRGGYESLKRIAVRTIPFDEFTVKVQFNPGRIVSSSAKVDAASISQRPCFLCRANRPPEQREIAVEDDLVLLCNPFPIFPEHFTIPTVSHVPQQIAGHFTNMLALARDLSPRYGALYNGPRCGASAPDHLHFQAGTRGFLPIDQEYPALPKGPILDRGDVRILAAGESLRRFVAIEGSDVAAMGGAFDRVYAALRRVAPGDDEPMMNLLASFADGLWRVIVLPRRRHRPSFYDAEGDARILISPAAVDLGGVCITPIERDFHRLTADQIRQMFEEVMLDAAAFTRVVDEIRSDPGPPR